MLHVVTTGAYYSPVVSTWKIFTTGASYLTTRTLCSRVNSTIHGVCHQLSNYPGRPFTQWVNSQIDQNGNRIFPKISRTCHSLSYEIRQLVWCFKIYWRYSFNGYWRMDFPDWGLIHVEDLSSRRIIQQLKFLPSSSYLFVSSSFLSDKISFPTWWWLHPGIFSRRRHFYDLMDHLWPGSWLFCLSTVSTHLFQLKATVLTIFVCC